MVLGAVSNLAPEIVGIAVLVFGVLLVIVLSVPLRNLDRPGSKSFAIFIASVVLYTMSTGVNLLTNDLVVSIWANKTIVSCAVLLGVGWALLGVEMNSRTAISRPVVAITSTYVVIAIAVTWVNPGNIFIGADARMAGVYLAHDVGTWYWAMIGITIALVLIGTALLVIESISSAGIRQRQAILLSTGILPSILGGFATVYLLATSETPHYDYTVFGFALTALILGVALYDTRFLDVAPVARRRAFDEMREAVVTVDDWDRVIDCNKSARRLFDVEEEPAGMPADEFFEQFGDDVLEVIDGASEADATVTATIDGEERHFSLSSTPIRESGRVGTLLLLHDVTERTRREQSLREFKQAVEHAGHGVMITGTDGSITYANPQLAAQTGYDVDELVGESPGILSSGEHDEAFYDDLWETITSGERWQNEVINERKNGEHYYVDQTIAPIIDDEGTIQAFISVNHEITDRKQAKRRITEQRDGLEILNQVVRHDIRNDLQLIQAYAEILGDAEELEREYLDIILDRAESATDLTRTARELSEVLLEDELDPVSIPIETYIEDEVESVGEGYPEAQIEVHTHLPGVAVEADEMLHAVLRNLLTNAIQHNDTETPLVSVSTERVDDRVRVRIADDGPGLSEEEKETVFQQGKKGAESEGTGIGLYLVDTLVSRYGGAVWVEDNEPEGSIFVVELPIASAADDAV